MSRRTLQKQERTKRPELEAINPILNKELKEELSRLQRCANMGYEVTVEWLPGTAKYHNGKKLAELVVGDTILVFKEDQEEALELVRHGFAEWILNQHTKPYRQLINKLITMFEEQQYERKEKIVEALTNLLS
ncbi:MAG: hypothetical protein NWE91_02795 [Candidatus Bathyarchaeota archaeon]|nr:hypothetical protein [Candidatus Bathyarchaeota archaeon]